MVFKLFPRVIYQGGCCGCCWCCCVWGTRHASQNSPSGSTVETGTGTGRVEKTETRRPTGRCWRWDQGKSTKQLPEVLTTLNRLEQMTGWMNVIVEKDRNRVLRVSGVRESVWVTEAQDAPEWTGLRGKKMSSGFDLWSLKSKVFWGCWQPFQNKSTPLEPSLGCHGRQDLCTVSLCLCCNGFWSLKSLH